MTDVINPPAHARPQFYTWTLVAAVVAGALLRFSFLTADPPTHATVGIVWHDEGAWTHNARNKALFGAWSLDAWNPLFIAPVFTVGEYLAFEGFGVGLWQARLMPVVLGLLSIPLLALGVSRIAGVRAGAIAGAMLATNYVYVMWTRAALMEGPMTAFIVAGWYCYVRAEHSPRWAWGAAVFALVAFFTKAAAVFFMAAMALDAAALLLLGRRYSVRSRAAAAPTLLALTTCGLVALALFVIPNWADYHFYNWQMSVTRKPTYDVASLVNRLTWFPILHDVFTRMWFALVVGAVGALAALASWRNHAAGERLLVLWLFIGAAELLVHDVGNERRFVFFIPALIGVTSIVLGGHRPLLAFTVTRRQALLAAPLVAYAAYVIIGALVRVLFLYEVRPNVRLAAGAALMLTGIVYALWPHVSRWLASVQVEARTAVVLTTLVVVGDCAQYGQWMMARTHENYEASRLIGERLAPGTLVHGKLANGLALENRIRPVFVGHGFGNFDDRRTRDDVRYILTYVAPCVGFEGSQIHDVLDAYPNRSIVMTFDVAETPGGHDRAVLIDKFGGAADRLGEPCDRAQD